jgi:hypothetical protein
MILKGENRSVRRDTCHISYVTWIGYRQTAAVAVAAVGLADILCKGNMI